MSAEFRAGSKLWAEIQGRATKTTRLTACVGYVGRHPMDVIKWREGDTLIADPSEENVRRGICSAKGASKLLNAGVRVFRLSVLSQFRSAANNRVDVVHTGLAPLMERGSRLSGLNSGILRLHGLTGADSPVFVRVTAPQEDTPRLPPFDREPRSPKGERGESSGDGST